MRANTALITGITGQDGSYLAELLLSKNYEVVGITRQSVSEFGINLAHLKDRIKLVKSSYDVASLVQIIREVRPAEIYNLAGQTYVGKSWDMLDETMSASAVLPCNLLEAVVQADRNIRVFQASSCEMYSLDWETTVREGASIAPRTPYGCAKALAHNMVACYRHQYGLYAVSGILFHHESPRRYENFLSRKVVKHAVEIKLGRRKDLLLGNVDVMRDWSFAPDIVIAIDLMMRRETPEDFVVCSGELHSPRELMETVFALLDLDPRQHVHIDQTLFRTAEPPVISGSNEKAKAVLGWQPKTSFRQMLEKMVAYEIALQTRAVTNFADERPFA